MIFQYFSLVVIFFISLYVFSLTIRRLSTLYSLRFISGYYTFQFAAIFFYLLSDPKAHVWNSNTTSFILTDYIFHCAYYYLLFQISILLVVFLASLVLKTEKKPKSLVDLIFESKRKLFPLLYFSAIIVISYPFLRGTALWYPSAILFNYLNFIPFVAGVLFFQNNRLRNTWIFALLLLFVLGIMTGGRGTAFTSLSLYGFGVYFALNTKRQRRLFIGTSILIAIPVASFMAFVGIFRHIVGRVDFDKLTVAHVMKIYNTYEKIKDSKALNLNSQDGKMQGLGRLVNFVNIYQFATVPNTRNHLGFEGLISSDLYHSFDLSFISGSTLEERYRDKAGNYRLNDFGYLVTPETSVEYSIVTEGYIRFGGIGIFAFGAFFSIFLVLTEYLIYISFLKVPTIRVFTTVMICQQTLLSYSYNVFPIMRNIILAIFAAITIVYLFELTRIVLKSPQKNK